MLKYILIITTFLSYYSCKEKVVLDGTSVEIVSAAGQSFKNADYLSAPLAHGVLTHEDDTLNILILTKYDKKTKMLIQPLATFQIQEGATTTPYLLAFPSDDKLLSMPRMSYNDFVIKNNSAKVIIDMYYSNYKGLGETRVVNWQNTHIAKKLLSDFVQKSQ